jgi:hypothetical protein
MHRVTEQRWRRTIPLDMSIPPHASSAPDYPALIDALLNLCTPLDCAGETILTPDEAAQIRACGIEARAGKWYCPALPASIVGTVWMLSHLSDDIDPATRPIPWREKRAAIRHVSPIVRLSKFERRLIERLENAPGQCLDRRALKRTYWRRGAWFVHRTIELLLIADHITEYGGFLHPYSRAEFKALLEAQSRPRRPVPVSTIY